MVAWALLVVQVVQVAWSRAEVVLPEEVGPEHAASQAQAFP